MEVIVDVSQITLVEEPWKMGKKFVKDLLAPALELMPILDLLSGVHPAIGVVVGIFKVF